jgi:hypothetical protein
MITLHPIKHLVSVRSDWTDQHTRSSARALWHRTRWQVIARLSLVPAYENDLDGSLAEEMGHFKQRKRLGRQPGGGYGASQTTKTTWTAAWRRKWGISNNENDMDGSLAEDMGHLKHSSVTVYPTVAAPSRIET